MIRLTAHSTPSRLLATTAGLLLLAGLSGCGDDSPASASASASDPDPSPTASSAAPATPSSADASPAAEAGDPVAALRTILQAFQDGDGATACPLQTKRYTAYSIEQTVSLGGLPAGSTCADTVRYAGELAKKYGVDGVSGAYDVTSNDGSRAVVAHDQGGRTVTYTLVTEDGAWHLDAEKVPGS